jgi:RNA polymerase sigma-70 factor (ECF subfamily)
MKPDQARHLRDANLLRKAQQDPESQAAREAVGELFDHYRGHIYQWCFRYVHDHEQALDMTQEVMLEAFKSLSSFRGGASFSSWLFAITRNRCVSALRRSSRQRTVELDCELLADPRSGADQALEERQEGEILLAAISEHLAPREQEALCLRLYEMMPVDTITQVLGIEGVAGARSVLQNARRKLRVALGRRRTTQGGS